MLLYPHQQEPLRTRKDVYSGAEILGISKEKVDKFLEKKLSVKILQSLLYLNQEVLNLRWHG